MTAGDDQRFDWRRGGAAAIALVATLILLGMVVLVAMTNTARDRALEAERHAYDVTLLTRTIDASVARNDSANTDGLFCHVTNSTFLPSFSVLSVSLW